MWNESSDVLNCQLKYRLLLGCDDVRGEEASSSGGLHLISNSARCRNVTLGQIVCYTQGLEAKLRDG